MHVLGFGPRRDRSRDVEDDVLAPYGRVERGAGVQVTLDERSGAEEGQAPGRVPDQRGDLVAAPQQGFDEVAADEPRRASDERLHTGRSYRR